MGSSRLDNMAKPSMMSVAESHANEENDRAAELDRNQSKAFGLSAFKATQSGISQASLVFGKSIHNSNFRHVDQSTISTVAKHVEKIPMPKKF